MSEHKLPSSRDCRATLETVNKVREVLGKEPLEYLPFDEAVPRDWDCCLIAKATGRTSSYYGDTTTNASLVGLSRKETDDVRTALGSRKAVDRDDIVLLSAPVTRVVWAFDNEYEGLRERMVKAGVVKA